MRYFEKEVNILIVDDTPQHITMAGEILKPLGYPIRVATNGQRAFEMIHEQKPTLILLDVQMEGLSGFDVCSHLKQSSSYEDIAIIFMTASDDEESITKGFKLGAQDYVIKPYHASELLARVTTHIRLAVQTAALKASYGELEQFTHTVSHDLKAPLLVCTQLCELLEEELSQGNYEDAVNICTQIKGKSIRLTDMVARLLEFSKVGIAPCHFTQVDMKELFARQLQELSSLEPQRTIQWELGDLPAITGDPTLLELLVQNIISNALKFSQNQEVTDIKIHSSSQERKTVIWIRDNGAGFDMQYADKLFRIFQRLHSVQEFEGSGVGLAICQRIMQRHGGNIRIEGQPDEGACVYLEWQPAYFSGTTSNQ